MLLIDTSVWIQVFRKSNPLDLLKVTSFENIVIVLPIIQEVLQGFRDEGAYRLAHQAMFSLPIVDSPLESETFEQAISLYRTARKNGFTIRSSLDCLIAASAIRHDLTVLHIDRDFPLIGKVSTLKQRKVI